VSNAQVFKIALAAFLLTGLAFANTPGKHTVKLTWIDGACSVAGTCSANVYRGTSPNVCSGTPTPLATGITGGTYTDLNPPTGTVYYNVSDVDPGKGGESTCNGEVQVSVQTITTNPPTSLSGSQQ